MDDRDWLTLQVLYEQKSITKTAQSLFISQPALTAHLRQIEEQFGVKIVNRTSKGVQFTPQGDYLVKCATEMLQKMQKIKEQVKNMDNKISGTLRLGASNYFTMFLLPTMLKLFKQKYPNVEFKVTTAWSKDVFQQVYNQEVHVGFIRVDYGGQNEKHLLFEEQICIASKEKINIEDLPHLPRIDFKTDYLINTLLDKWWRENFSKPPSISMEIDKLATCKEMVINGLGYAIMPAMILDGIDDIHKIFITDKQGKPLLRKTWMIYQKESLETNVVAAFVKFVKNMEFKNGIVSLHE